MFNGPLATIAGRQLGLITRSQLRDQLSARQILALVRDEVLLPVHPNVYRHAAAPQTWHQRELAAVLGGGPGSFASHQAAGLLWGVRDRLGPPEILVLSPSWPRLTGVRVHRTNLLPPAHTTVRGGIPCTSLVRTVFDLSAVLHPYAFGRALDRARRMQPGFLDALDRITAELSVRGRRRLTVVRDGVAAREDEQPGGSNQELRVVRVLRRARLGGLRQQHKVVFEGVAYHLDAAYPDDMVAVEHQGPGHADLASLRADTRRRNALERAGWFLAETADDFTDDEIVATVRGVLERSRRARRSPQVS